MYLERYAGLSIAVHCDNDNIAYVAVAGWES